MYQVLGNGDEDMTVMNEAKKDVCSKENNMTEGEGSEIVFGKHLLPEVFENTQQKNVVKNRNKRILPIQEKNPYYMKRHKKQCRGCNEIAYHDVHNCPKKN